MEKNCTKCKYITPIAGVDYGFCNHKDHLGRVATENTTCSEHEFKDKVDKIINGDLIKIKEAAEEGGITKILKTAHTNDRTGEVDYPSYYKELERIKNNSQDDEDDPFACEYQPKITFGPYVLQESGRFYIDDFVGSRANDGTAFAIGSRNSGERLVLNYKGISALLITKYGNFDLGAFDVSDNVTELEFNGVLFKKVENKGE